MTTAIDLRRPESELSRTELTLIRLGRAWVGEADGRRYTEALLDFLRARHNPNTLRSYSYAILEFFGWYERERERIPTPAMVRRADAVAFERWLRERKTGLAEWYLLHDPSRRLDAAIYVICRERPGIGIDGIRQVLLGRPEFATERLLEREGRMVADKVLRIELEGPGLARRLGCLIDVKTISRSPTLEQIRRGQVDVGLPPAHAARLGIDRPVPPEVFRYAVPSYDTDPAARASTVASRLAALSALWEYLMQSGENLGAATPLLRINIWVDLLRQAQRQAPSQQRIARAKKTPGPALFEAILATTFARRHGAAAPLAARAQMDTRVAMPGALVRAPRESFADLRDRAILLLLGQTGIRADELGHLRRADFGGSPPMLTIRGKGGKARALRVPPAAARAIEALQSRLVQLVAHQERYHPAAGAAVLLQPPAPLLPALERWGKNAGGDRMAGLSRPGIAMMLRRRAIAAGIEPGSEDFARIHPHGLRHLFAHEADAQGTPIPVIQAIMGHERGDTTLRYMEAHDPTALVARGYAPLPAPPPMVRAPAAEAAVAPTIIRPPRPRVAAAPPPVPRPPQPEPTPPVPAPAAPAPPEEEEGLVAHGEAPSYLPSARAWEAAESVRELERIYTSAWGEPGARQRFSVSAAIETAPLDEELAAIIGVPLGAEPEPIHHVYAGSESGLLWWLGPSGRLADAMPILSPGQLGSCGPDDPVTLCSRLGALWAAWVAGERPGPTGAAALMQWIDEALRLASIVHAEIVRRKGDWVAPDSPWSATAMTTGPRLVFREHAPDAIVAWFERMGSSWRPTRAGHVQDDGGSVPAYYAEADPIASLTDAEQVELLDWLLALTGGMPRDDTPRYRGASRADLGRLIGLMCVYDQQDDLLDELREQGEASRVELVALEHAVRQAAQAVNRAMAALGGPPDYSITRAAEERRKGRIAGTRELRQSFYLRELASHFGPESAADPNLRLVAHCGRAPLAEERYKELFRVDWFGRTITHEPRVREEFATATGAHSECVARRIARDLWEMHKRERATGKEERLLRRPDELVEHLDTLLSYKIPCPEALEGELRRRLRTRTPQPVFEAWARERTSAARGGEGAIEREFKELEEAFSGAIATEFAGQYRENAPKLRQARMRLPTPLHLLVVRHAMIESLP